MPDFAETLSDQVAVSALEYDRFVSVYKPESMGNTAKIAYGGCAIAIAISAAYQTMDSQYSLYTAMGHYLGPALVDRPLFAAVRRIRDTRTFATRQVEISQIQDNGSARVCMIVSVDFHTKEKASLLEYSASPSIRYQSVEALPTVKQASEVMIAQGKVSRTTVDFNEKQYALRERLVESRPCPEGMAYQTMNGEIKVPTTQDNLPLVDRFSGDYFKAKHQLANQAEQMAALGFIMDGALSFIPLTHSSMSLRDAAACSSLDFALRIFTHDIDINDWHFREFKTVVGGEGRTYSESRLWDRAGKMVANMTQQSILRSFVLQPKASL
ncbi:Thioesterase/thiol ester dehydrase-isomerase [Paraphaeosphaeria sporulosa]|uniref:Thioesterase/thiol ester dehydrase-isomerase n=1 Tax=Paraphaeosphaeria sporulosa TaxID=1460663 RepID=A0A177CPT0_9PLEO|nr:Thioesterase/thiol ester dehydrase-isomerase [Paraphaeosphaeria sporulosa]OAG08789.1 Thioesterase/thiol ester dehydrase-isomerase [Paraphaeosphaeria sporulosa]